MRNILTLLLLLLIIVQHAKSQYHYFDCATNQTQLPFNNVYDSIVEKDSLTNRFIFDFTVRLTSVERKQRDEFQRLPVNIYRLIFTPNHDFTAFSIDGFTRDCYVNHQNPYNGNFVIEMNEYSEKGYFNFNNINSVVSLQPLYNMKLEDLISKLDSSNAAKLLKIVRYHFINNITNYTELLNSDTFHTSVSSTYLKYKSNSQLLSFKPDMNKLLKNHKLKHYALPIKGTRILKEYERSHEVDTDYVDGYQMLITSQYQQIGFKIKTSLEQFNPKDLSNKELLKGMGFKPSSTLGFKNDITFLGIVFLNKFNVSETIWIDVDEIKKYSNFETELLELKFLLKNKIELKSKSNGR